MQKRLRAIYIITSLMVALVILGASLYSYTKQNARTITNEWESESTENIVVGDVDDTDVEVVTERLVSGEANESSVEEIKTYISEVFITDEAASWASHIVNCESTFNPNALGTSGDTGLFQFLPTTYAANGGTDIWDWREQVRVAHFMYLNNQQYQWTCNQTFL